MSPKCQWLKDKNGRSLQKWNKGRSAGVRTSALLASPIYTGQAQGEEKNHIKREAQIEPLSSFGSARP